MLAGFLTYLRPSKDSWAPLVLFNMVSSSNLLLSPVAVPESLKKRGRREGEGERERGLLRLKLAHCQFSHILLTKAKYKASSDSRGASESHYIAKGVDTRKSRELKSLFFFNQNTTLTWLRLSVQGWLGGLIISTLVFFAVSKRESFQYFITNYNICCSFLFSRGFFPL